MSRLKSLFTLVLPSMLAGGLLFGTASGHAAAGDGAGFGFWPVADVTTPTTAGKGSASKPKAPPAPPAAPTPPTAKPAPRAPAAPPAPPAPKVRGKVGGGFSVDGIKDLVTAQLDAAKKQIKNNASIPADVRAKLTKRLDKVQATLDKRLGNLKLTDLSKLGDEMEKMGEEIEEAMEGLEDDLEKLGDQLGDKLGKDLAKQLGKMDFDFDFDFDDDDDVVTMSPGVAIDADDDDLRDALADLKDVALKPAQRTAIAKLRADSDKTVAAAKKQIDDLSAKLESALGNTATSDADIGRYVDQISAQEAAIRKARILAWVQARRVLDDGQRKKIEDAAKKKSK